ncbi:MAG: hypothetical protein ABI904_23130 [Chloroflexota bacterium]
MNFNFGEVLTRAWKIIWNNKVLWIFGILASCGRGGGGSNGGSGSNNNSNGSGLNLPPQMQQWLQWIQEHLTQFIAITVVLLCITWIIVAFLSTIGKIGLIRGTAQAEGGTESLIFGQLFSESTPYFWRMFGLSLILSLPILLFVGTLVAGGLVLGLSAMSGGGAATRLGALTMVPLMLGCVCLLVPVMFVVGMIFTQSERAIVLEDLGVLPAISRGWDIFRANLGPIILMTIILVVIGFVVGLVIAIPVLIIVIPAMIAFFAGGGQSTIPLIFMAVCFCLYLPVLLLLNGILTAYSESAWTLTYMRLTQKPDSEQPKLDDAPPAEPEDSNRTIIATKPNA